MLVLACACGFLISIDTARIRHVAYVSEIGWEAPSKDPASPTGYSGGARHLIVPEHNPESYQWIVQTQSLVASGAWHIRHADYDNAPFGREVLSPSPYRWWLASCAWIDRLFAGGPPGLSVEGAALFADPALHVLLLIAAAAFTAWQFGGFAAALLAVAIAALYPLAGEFLPGQPTDHGLSQAAALASMLLLLAGVGGRAAAPPPAGSPAGRGAFWCFFAAGAAGAAGLWVNVSRQLPLVAGIALGWVAVCWLVRPKPGADEADALPHAPWRAWGIGGAIMILLACAAEGFPATGLRLHTLHPLQGILWLAAGEWLAWTGAVIRRATPGRRRLAAAAIAVGVLVAAAIPTLMLLSASRGLWADNGSPDRLTNLPGGPDAAGLLGWMRSDGFDGAAWAVFLPILLFPVAIGILVRRAATVAGRAGLALALGPVAVVLAMSFVQLRWWNLLDALLAVLLVAVAAGTRARAVRWLLAAGALAALAPGVLLLVRQVKPGTRETVTESEVEGLLERDLARWLAVRAGPGGAVVLAPPNVTASLIFYASLRGLGTPYWENADGFTAAIRIAGASTPDEAQAVARGRGVTDIVIPSWDNFLDEYARLGSASAEHSLTALLHRWLPPRWLEPVPYRLPRISGFEDQSVVIFAAVDVQDNAAALSRLAEYFVEMGQPDQAASVGEALVRFFPADLGAAVARALVAQSLGDTAAAAAMMDELASSVARGEDRSLPWDRRVSLAIALAQGRRTDLARDQVRRCLAELDEPRIRSLTPLALYRLQVLGTAFGIPIADPRLRDLAQRLLPSELRAKP